MSLTPGGILRTFGLWLLILSDAALISLMFWRGNGWWGWFFATVTFIVCFWEIVSYANTKKTISTRYKEFIQKHPVQGYLGLILFSLAMAGLVIHLAFF